MKAVVDQIVAETNEGFEVNEFTKVAQSSGTSNGPAISGS